MTKNNRLVLNVASKTIIVKNLVAITEKLQGLLMQECL
jgi:hypothetical protein